jgi:signal transduction histidine kinase
VARLSRTSAFWLLHVGGWLAFGAWMAAWGLESWSLEETLIRKAFLVAMGFLLTLLFPRLFRAFLGASPAAFAFLAASTVSAGALVWTVAYELFIDVRSHAVPHLGVPVGTLLVNALALLAWSVLYLGLRGWLALNAERLRAARAEALAHEARLRVLRSQLEPHFIFNTLNAISTLVRRGDQDRAVEMIASLSGFLRDTLATLEAPVITLAQELDLVSRYLAIQKVRFGDRLTLRWDVRPEALADRVPALILQPLVENALKHGVLPREGGGSLSLAALRNGGHLEIAVVDDGPGLPRQGFERGIGLRNTEARLRELYGVKAEFSLAPGPHGGLAATLRIPLEGQAVS